ncbi:hypothetical protein FOC1_g10008756 [Fusarium oxysporum f. sp. cubense race 1]|uniref:Coenzyme Q-binding protein COQ10 START domain-containing protein n=3 Tax=Fusarium oxysporum TaxID=5507 RepID=N4UBR5_FUSC1|nr:hypothetical protein FOC1_g10008756 [Fusarium oxysporum f. sp. cubense race 1]
MGQKASLVVEVEIDAPVEVVKLLFKDFPRFPEWSSWSIEPVVSSKKIDDLMPMEKMKVDVKDAKLTATLLVSNSFQIPQITFLTKYQRNDPDVFEWEGGLWPLVTGRHEFSWRASRKTPGGTTFTQRENWHGLIVFLWKPGWIIGRSAKRNFEGFSAEVKREAERRAAVL